MVCGNFILPEVCKPCLFLSSIQFAQLILHYQIYVYGDDVTDLIDGFIGLTDSYIAGLFVKDTAQSKGIGKQLLDYAKSIRSEMSLSVYQENVRAVHFYKRERFQVQAESVDDNTNAKEFIMTWNK